jgi:2-keto-4-pentenoate hydratase/2-oxohepta-3-ene-1,7-dioic acid hydratase in catechol pathway
LRIARIKADRKTKYAIVKKNKIYGYHGSPFLYGRFPNSSFNPDGTEYDSDRIRFMVPCTPTKIICLGFNYHSHIAEFKESEPKSPILFLKPLTSLIGPGDNIILPNKGRIDYEGELAVVMGKKAKDISKKDVKKHILGYTCFNDVTDRIAQKADGQWTRAKGYDTFAAVGPWIETEINADDVLVETYVNGDRRQSQRTSELIFDIPEIISYISGIMTLLPGDIIATGTPAGMGPLNSGDVVEIKIEKLGTLNNIAKNK